MKRIVALFLSAAMLLTGCSSSASEDSTTSSQSTTTVAVTEDVTETSSQNLVWTDVEPEYTEFNDELLAHIEDLVYMKTVELLDSDMYFVENVSAIYISQEYIDEVAFNSQSNIFFGYTLAEIDKMFEGTRYVFTLGEDGNTAVQELEEIVDTDTDTIIKNIAIGTGVILICVTVSVVTAGVGAPAISMIFAASAKTAIVMATSSAAFGGVSAGVVRGIETGDMGEALDAAALGASEGYKWGAISGAVSGGASQAIALKGFTLNGLTMNEAALIQKESNLPLDIIKQLHSYDEFLVYQDAGLKPVMVNGQTALIQNIDLKYVSKLPDGTEITNLVRMQRGYAPLDPLTGKAYQLHHIGQKSNGTLAVLTESQHQGNASILNIFGKEFEITRSEFTTVRKEFWEYVGKVIFTNGGI